LLGFEPSIGCTVVLRGGTETLLAEASRAFHDALWVVDSALRDQVTFMLCMYERSLRKRAVLGAGVTESALAVQLLQESEKQTDVSALCKQAFAEVSILSRLSDFTCLGIIRNSSDIGQ